MERYEPTDSSAEMLKPNELTAAAMHHFEADAYTLFSKIPAEVRGEVADALGDFHEQFNAFQNPGHQLSTPDSIQRARELVAKLKSFKI